MAFDLVEKVGETFSKKVLENFSALTGCDAGKTSAIAQTAVVAIVGELSGRVTDPVSAGEIFRAMKNQDGGVLVCLDALTGDGSGAMVFQKSGEELLRLMYASDVGDLAKRIFGAQTGQLLRPHELLAKLAPIVIAVAGRQVKNKSLNVAGMSSLLVEQKAYLEKHLAVKAIDRIPSSTSRARPDAIPLAANKVEESAAGTKPAAPKKKSSIFGIVILLLLGLVASVILWRFGFANGSASNPESQTSGSGTQTDDSPIDTKND